MDTASFQWTDLVGILLIFFGLGLFGYGLSTKRPGDRISACIGGVFVIILGIRFFYGG